MIKIAVARFGHEGNAFIPRLTPLEAFEAGEWAKGDEVYPMFRGTNTEIGGAIAFFDCHPEIEPVFGRVTFASPAGLVDDNVFEEILGEILSGLREQAWDGIYLGQHGALGTPKFPHADMEVLRRVREVVGDVPLGMSYDLHANITQEEMDLVDVAVGYKCHPHTDMAAVAEKCLDLLTRTIQGEIHPVGVVVKVGAIIPSINARTTDGPMAEVAEMARRLEREKGLLDVTPNPAYAYADTEAAGAACVVFADGDRAAALAAAHQVVGAIWERIDRLFVTLPDTEEGIRQAIDLTEDPSKRPVAIIDMADHPGAGALADTPGFLRALLQAAPEVPTAFVFFYDPESVAQAWDAGIGNRVSLVLGGRFTDEFGPPVTVEANVEKLVDLNFIQRGPMQAGLRVDYGRTAVVNAAGIKVVITSVCRMVTDPLFFELLDIDLSTLGILATKAKNQFQAAFKDRFHSMIYIDAPGPATMDFRSLPFKRVSKSLYPFTQ